MRILVLYYSRTGTTRALATALAHKMSATLAEIGCEKFDGGAIDYLLAGYASVRGKMPEIELPLELTNDYDLIVLGGPIWTSYPALPLRRFLKDYPDLAPKLALFVVGGNHSPPQKAIDMLMEMAGTEVLATITFNTKEVVEGRYEAKVNGFALALNKALRRSAPDQKRGKPGAANDDPPPGKKRKPVS